MKPPTLSKLQKEYLAYKREIQSLDFESNKFTDIPQAIQDEQARLAQYTTELTTIQATLPKPWTEYAGKKSSRWRRDPEPAHPIARECYQLQKRISYARESIHDYDRELATKDATIAESQKKRDRILLALMTVEEQLTRRNEPLPSCGNPGAYGDQCLAEVYALESAQKAYYDYARFLTTELSTNLIRL